MLVRRNKYAGFTQPFLTKKKLFGAERAGFTIFEIMVVIAIVGLLMAIVMPNYLNARRNAIVSTCLSNQKMIHTAAVTYMTLESESLEGMTDAERINTLIEKEYLRGSSWTKCPSSDIDGVNYTMIFDDGFIDDVECETDPTGHKWP